MTNKNNNLQLRCVDIFLRDSPVAQARSRFAYVNGHSLVFDPQKDKKRAAARKISNQILENGFSGPLKGSLCVEAVFTIQIPSGLNQIQKNKLLWDCQNICIKPDIDNLLKFYLDVMNGLVYEDDKQIVSVYAFKKVGVVPSVAIKVSEIDPIPEVEVMNAISPEEFDMLLSDMKHIIDLIEKEKNTDTISKNKILSLNMLSDFSKKYTKLINKISKL